MLSINIKPVIITALILSLFVNSYGNSSPLSLKLNYECIGQDSFLISLNLIVDCSQPDTMDSVLIHIQGDCTNSLNTYLNTKSISNTSPSCPRSVCNGGDIPGIKNITFSRLIVLHSNCNNWTFSYSQCCRDSSINTIGNPDIYLETSMSLNNSSCFNSSNQLSNIIFAELNKVNYYNFGCVDIDGDLLKYAFVQPLSSQNTPIVFQSGYSFNQAIQGITIDSLNGQVLFTPTLLGKFNAAIRVTEYDSNTEIEKGFSIINIIFHVKNYINNSPSTLNGITNITGNVTQISSDTIQVGYNEFISFDIEFTDADTVDLITLFSNVEMVLNGANSTISNGNPAHQFVSWTSTNQDETFTFSTTSIDDQCIVGLNSNLFVVIVGDGINAINQIDNSNLALSVFPNPSSSDFITLEFTLPASDQLEIVIFDITGKVYFQTTKNGMEGVNHIIIPIEKLTKGVYMVKLDIDGNMESILFVKY